MTTFKFWQVLQNLCQLFLISKYTKDYSESKDLTSIPANEGDMNIWKK